MFLGLRRELERGMFLGMIPPLAARPDAYGSGSRNDPLLFIDVDRREDTAARPPPFLSSGLALFDSELLSLFDVVVLIESRVILLNVDLRMEAVPADLVAALLAAALASVMMPLPPLAAVGGDEDLALLGDFMLCAILLILALTASEERKAGFGLTSGRGIIDPGEVFLGVGVGATAFSGCGEEANLSSRLPN